MDSILMSIKMLLGISENDTYFDKPLVMHINQAIFPLTQIGIGPKGGFVVRDDNTSWSEFMPDESPIKVEWVKSCVYYRVRLAFDPPSSQSLLQSINDQIKECENRLLIASETGV